MGFLWFLLAVLIIAIIIFVVWFIVEVKSGKCPFCALQRFTKPTKITMDISEDEKYSNGAALTPPMGWSSWNTLPSKHKRGNYFYNCGSYEAFRSS